MGHDFILSQSDGRPMYLQIIEQIKLRVAVGDWQSGFRLPSIRELAVDAKVSVITIKRAYQELENEGVIVTQQGKGSFVAAVDNLGQRLQAEELDQHLEQAIKTARSQKLSVNELIGRLKKLWQEQ